MRAGLSPGCHSFAARECAGLSALGLRSLTRCARMFQLSNGSPVSTCFMVMQLFDRANQGAEIAADAIFLDDPRHVNAHAVGVFLAVAGSE